MTADRQPAGPVVGRRSEDSSRSGRSSGRVEPSSRVLAGQGYPAGHAGPESLTRLQHDSAPPAPERTEPKDQPTVDQPVVSRLHAVRLRSLTANLSDRDQAVLQSLDLHAFLTTHQLQRWHFFDHATEAAASRICCRVLQRLSRSRLIEPLQRRVGGVRAGSASYVWRLGPAGDRLLRLQSGSGVRARRKEPSSYYLEHRLAVADAHLALVLAARAGRFELLEAAPEPGCWRPYLGPGGNQLTLKPDFFAVTASGEYEDAWFIEVDRGTESIPTLLRKCAQYEAYRRSGQEQHRRGVFPLVIWQLPHPARLDRLAAALRASQRLDQSLYRLTLPPQLLDTITGGSA